MPAVGTVVGAQGPDMPLSVSLFLTHCIFYEEVFKNKL